jgi:hypothetical protein
MTSALSPCPIIILLWKIHVPVLSYISCPRYFPCLSKLTVNIVFDLLLGYREETCKAEGQ